MCCLLLEIYSRDVAWLSESDIVIAECTSASLGVGYELAYAEMLKKPVLVLYNNNSPKRLSGMIAGHNYFEVVLYNDTNEAKQAIEAFINKHKNSVTAPTRKQFSSTLVQAIAELDNI